MTLADWLDRGDTAQRLISHGMSFTCAEQAAGCIERAARSFLQYADAAPATGVVACWAPGRIEVFGKHTDYCGGDSILAAVERGFCMLAVPRDDGRMVMIDPVAPLQGIELNPTATPMVGHWTNYPHTVVRRFAKNFPNARRGATIAIASNLPPSSGMSSSSAFVVGTFLLLSRINDLEHDPAYKVVIRCPEDLAGYLGTVENGASFGPLAGDRGVGTFGGSEDHTAILCSQPNRLVQYAYCPVHFRRAIELGDNYVFAIASSGVVAEKTGAALEKYNRISTMVRTIVDAWQSATGGDESSLAAILARPDNDTAKLKAVLSANAEAADLVERLHHFTLESSLIESVPDRIDASTISRFSEAAFESHSMANVHLKNQTAETNRLVEIAEELGAHGASAFGAGFGGSVWALVVADAAASFLAAWRGYYLGEFPHHIAKAEFFATRPGVPAFCDS